MASLPGWVAVGLRLTTLDFGQLILMSRQHFEVATWVAAREVATWKKWRREVVEMGLS